MTDPILKAENIFKSYNGSQILSNVSLSLNKGEVKVLVGPSGGGKSTLLQCINCLVRPDSGDIWLAHQKINIHHKKALYLFRQQVGMIFQDFNLFDHLKAVDNVAIALRKVKKYSRQQAETKARQELDQVGLGDKGHLFPAELSGGQKQRVAIARALAMEPKVLLLDEPTSALDPELIGEVIAVIRSLAQKGMTMLMATHQISLIRNLAHEVLFMENGKIVEQGSPDELLIKGSSSKSQGFWDRLNDISNGIQ